MSEQPKIPELDTEDLLKTIGKMAVNDIVSIVTQWLHPTKLDPPIPPAAIPEMGVDGEAVELTLDEKFKYWFSRSGNELARLSEFLEENNETYGVNLLKTFILRIKDLEKGIEAHNPPQGEKELTGL